MTPQPIFDPSGLLNRGQTTPFAPDPWAEMLRALAGGLGQAQAGKEAFAAREQRKEDLAHQEWQREREKQVAAMSDLFQTMQMEGMKLDQENKKLASSFLTMDTALKAGVPFATVIKGAPESLRDMLEVDKPLAFMTEIERETQREGAIFGEPTGAAPLPAPPGQLISDDGQFFRVPGEDPEIAAKTERQALNAQVYDLVAAMFASNPDLTNAEAEGNVGNFVDLKLIDKNVLKQAIKAGRANQMFAQAQAQVEATGSMEEWLFKEQVKQELKTAGAVTLRQLGSDLNKREEFFGTLLNSENPYMVAQAISSLGMKTGMDADSCAMSANAVDAIAYGKSPSSSANCYRTFLDYEKAGWESILPQEARAGDRFFNIPERDFTGGGQNHTGHIVSIEPVGANEVRVTFTSGRGGEYPLETKDYPLDNFRIMRAPIGYGKEPPKPSRLEEAVGLEGYKKIIISNLTSKMTGTGELEGWRIMGHVLMQAQIEVERGTLTEAQAFSSLKDLEEGRRVFINDQWFQLPAPLGGDPMWEALNDEEFSDIPVR